MADTHQIQRERECVCEREGERDRKREREGEREQSAHLSSFSSSTTTSSCIGHYIHTQSLYVILCDVCVKLEINRNLKWLYYKITPTK